MERIRFLSCGQRIEGTLVTPENMQKHNPGVVFFHGMTSSGENYIPYAQQLSKQGIVGMTLSIRGHKPSEGDFDTLTVNDAFADGLASYDFFAGIDYIDKGRIGLCGASLGAAIAAMISAQRTVKSLVLRVPATYTDQIMRMTFKQIMDDEGQIFQELTNISDTPSLQAIKQFNGSLLIITSEHDDIIPVTIPTQYFTQAEATAKKETFEIQGATHNLTDDNWRQQFIEKTIQWFVDTL